MAKEIAIKIDNNEWADYCKWAESKQKAPAEGEARLTGNDAGIAFLLAQIKRFGTAQQKENQKATIAERTPGEKVSIKDV